MRKGSRAVVASIVAFASGVAVGVIALVPSRLFLTRGLRAIRG